MDKIKVKLLNEFAQLPTKNHLNDAAFDLYASEDVYLDMGKQELVSTGVSMAIPDGYAGFIWPRSGLSAKYGIDVLAGVIDSGYRGEIKVCLIMSDYYSLYKINKGDRIAQITIQPVPKFELELSDSLDDTDRNDKGFGSSGL